MSAQPTLLPQNRSGRTFLVAASLLGVAGLAQLIALGWHLTSASPRPRPAETPAFVSRDIDSLLRGDSTPTAVSRPPQPLTAAAVPSASATGPSPAPVVFTTPVPRPLPNPNELLLQARLLRQRGDTRTALARLREAQQFAADNAEIISEMAVTYEQMSLLERAMEQWQRVYELGPEKAGAVWNLAELKLRTGVSGPSPAVREQREGVAPAGGGERETKIGIVEVVLKEEPDETAEKRYSLKVTVKNRPGRYIDSNKVSIQAYFYDLVENQMVVITNAETSFQWLTNPQQWDEATSQTLEATYFRPKATPLVAAPAPRGRKPRKGQPSNEPPQPEISATAPSGGSRVYAGYIVRLYYDRELQDARAEPEQLLKQYPPEQILGTE